jgi:diacylglycerol kinase (ATP)
MERKIAFVINPKAGKKKKINIVDFIKNNFNSTISYDIIIWDDKNNFDSVKQKIINGNYNIVVACGGDGTVNLVGSVVLNTSMSLGILPLGSGNGLARSNNIPMELNKALHLIETGNTSKIDSATINGKMYFCTAGIGFDAHIANKFATSTKRGFFSYFKISVQEFFKYKTHQYKIMIDGKTTITNAFLITIANAGQWGNDVYIAPNAILNDGILNISILKPFSLIDAINIGYKLFNKNIHQSKNLISLTGKEITIEYKGELPVHFDGEPFSAKNKISIVINPLSLSIVK